MEDDNDLDPSIKVELERLNSTSKKINDLENSINEKRSEYRQVLTTSTQQLNTVAKKLGDCINKARPYYEAKRLAKRAHNEAQKGALEYEKSVSVLHAARDMVTVAEKGMQTNPSDTAWAEMLNHATIKVNAAEIEKIQSEVEHRKRAEEFKKTEDKMNKLKRSLKSNIKKSQPYFELKRESQEKMESITDSVSLIQKELKEVKQLYSATLKNLEKISESIHASRKEKLSDEQRAMILGKRQEGVGAETPFNEQEIVDNYKAELLENTNRLIALQDLGDSDSVEQSSSQFETSSVDSTSITSCSSTGSMTCKTDNSSLLLVHKRTHSSGKKLNNSLEGVVSVSESSSECKISQESSVTTTSASSSTMCKTSEDRITSCITTDISDKEKRSRSVKEEYKKVDKTPLKSSPSLDSKLLKQLTEDGKADNSTSILVSDDKGKETSKTRVNLSSVASMPGNDTASARNSESHVNQSAASSSASATAFTKKGELLLSVASLGEVSKAL